MNWRQGFLFIAVACGLGAFPYSQWAWQRLSWDAVVFFITAPIAILCVASCVVFMWLATADIGKADPARVQSDAMAQGIGFAPESSSSGKGSVRL